MGYYRRWKKPQHKSFSKDKKEHREEISSLIDNFLKDGNEFTKPRHIIYEEYIKSDEWKVTKRKEAMDLLGNECEICGYDKSLHLHHNNYNTFKAERVDQDLALVCRMCHNSFHDVVKSDKLTISPTEGCCTMCCKPSICSFSTKNRVFKLCKGCWKIFKAKLRKKKLKFIDGWKPPKRKSNSTSKKRRNKKKMTQKNSRATETGEKTQKTVFVRKRKPKSPS